MICVATAMDFSRGGEKSFLPLQSAEQRRSLLPRKSPKLSASNAAWLYKDELVWKYHAKDLKQCYIWHWVWSRTWILLENVFFTSNSRHFPFTGNSLWPAWPAKRLTSWAFSATPRGIHAFRAEIEGPEDQRGPAIWGEHSREVEDSVDGGDWDREV